TSPAMTPEKVVQYDHNARLGGFKPRSNGPHAAGESPLNHQPAAEQSVDKREQLTFWRGNFAIHGRCKLILVSAPVQRRQRPADGETLAHRDQTGFPRRIRIGNAVTWRNDIPSFPPAPYRLQQGNPAKGRVSLHTHSAALACCGELWTGRRALWTG